MQKPRVSIKKIPQQTRDKKQQLADKKQNKIKENSDLFKQRKKKQEQKGKEAQYQAKADEKEYSLDNIDMRSVELQEASKKLMKISGKKGKTSKSKLPAKIKVKNKFFSDLNIEIGDSINDTQKVDSNLIEEELSSNGTRKLTKTASSSQIIIDKSKQASDISNKSKLQSLVQKTDFIRARHDFKKYEEDTKYKSEVKKMLSEVHQVDEVVISDLSIPQIHRNKLISSSMYIASQTFKKTQNKNIQPETSKKLTAEEIIIQRKMLKNRDYFYKKLGQRIKEERFLKAKEVEGNSKILEKTDIDFTGHSQNKKVNQNKKLESQIKVKEKQKSNGETVSKVLTENSIFKT